MSYVELKRARVNGQSLKKGGERERERGGKVEQEGTLSVNERNSGRNLHGFCLRHSCFLHLLMYLPYVLMFIYLQ